jgi:hypothetical protein
MTKAFPSVCRSSDVYDRAKYGDMSREPFITPVTPRFVGCSVRAAGFWARAPSGPVSFPADVEIGKLDESAGKYPKAAADLRAIAASVQHVD